MNAPLIEFIDVTKRFGPKTVLEKVNLCVYEGDVTTIIGKSGTGKSVLLKHIIGLLKPDEGAICFNGTPLPQLSRGEKNQYLGKISYMFQNNALFDSLTVFDNVAMPLRYTTKLSKREIEQKVRASMEQTDLADVPNKYPSELSGGMQKRVALARALVTDPKIVLFDEPTTGQDPIRKNAILSMVAEYQRRFGFTALLISHDIPDVFFISNRILALYEGQIIFQGTPEQLDKFKHPFMDEILQSLESLQTELTGMHSRRSFRLRYQADLSRRQPLENYAVVLAVMDNLEEVSKTHGNTAAQILIRSLGDYINKHFGPVGGFSTRYAIDQFVTVLPYSDVTEARTILDSFTEDFNENGVAEIKNQVKQAIDSPRSLEFVIRVGLAQGSPQVELDSIVEFAKFDLTELSRFECQSGTCQL